MTIIEAIEDRNLFGSYFKDPSTWRAWMVYLRALFGLGLDTAEELEVFKRATELESPPGSPVGESYVIAGRRSGKSFISAVTAVFLSCFKDWRPYLAPGERGMVFIIAVDKAQAAIIKRYVSGLLHGSAMLRRMLEKETRESIDLKNKISIMVKTFSFRTLRGYTVCCAILEELAFYRSEESANPDREIVTALRPALATVPGSLLLGISTPYSRSGVLWEQFKTNFGKAGGPLIWRAPSLTMNPTLDRAIVEKALREDPEAARAEWETAWRTDISTFIPLELVESCIIPGRHELPKVKGVEYVAFVDPSGGRQDSFTLAVAHRERSGKIILDALREQRPPFKPENVVSEFSDFLKLYGISEVVSDRFAGEWVTDSFKRQGISVKASELPASALYLELLPLVSNGSVELLDSKRLVSQFVGLERRTRSGGKDLITHYPGGHDDLANAAAGSLYLAASKERSRVRLRSLTSETKEEREQRLKDEEEDARIDLELDKEDEEAEKQGAQDDHLWRHGWKRFF
jgi:hypothetical protein